MGAIALTVLAGMLLASYGMRHADGQATLDDYYISAVFNRVDGLDIGDDVRLSGVKVGTVDSMALQPDYRARVTLRLSDSVILPADSSAAIHTDGLFGSKHVVLDPGGEERILQNGEAIIYTQDALIVSELLELIIAEGKANRTPQSHTENGQ